MMRSKVPLEESSSVPPVTLTAEEVVRLPASASVPAPTLVVPAANPGVGGRRGDGSGAGGVDRRGEVEETAGGVGREKRPAGERVGLHGDRPGQGRSPGGGVQVLNGAEADAAIGQRDGDVI